MKNIRFAEHILPHLVAIAAFLLVTIFFFKPVFFDHKSIEQGDIQQWEGSSKLLRDFRNETGEEGLWASTMFSGMPAYLINVEWGNKPVSILKSILSFGLPHPVSNIFLAFLSYYIMLLCFSVRPYLAIVAAFAFGLSTYMIIGLSAGHNARIGAIAFMPLVIGSIHLLFSGRLILGFGFTTAAVALHLRENHLQITYYMAIILAVYAIISVIVSYRNGTLASLVKPVALAAAAGIIAVGTFIGPLWGITEYTKYSIRGKSELNITSLSSNETQGLNKSYAFEYSNGILEPITLFLPNFYGGSSFNFFAADENSETYKALIRSGNEQTINQLANYTSAYWGPQDYSSPYYAGAIVFFLFAVGIAFAPRRYVWWLLPLVIFGIVLSWGRFFPGVNYFFFDYLPGYNKFRSMTFALIIPLFCMPLLGVLGIEQLWTDSVTKDAKKKLLIALASTAGVCLLILVFGGSMDFLKETEKELPSWFTNALASDRQSLLTSDAIRSIAFIAAIFALLYFDVYRKISPAATLTLLAIFMVSDLGAVNKRYFTDNNYRRAKASAVSAMNEADQEILKDKTYYRVFNIQGTYNEARTSYFHHSIGGYHGAKLRRYQDLYDSCLSRETGELIEDLRAGSPQYANYGVLNMLNAKYFVYGPQRDNVIRNPAANGSAWFVRDVEVVNSPTEELQRVCAINTRTTAVVDGSKFKLNKTNGDTTGTVSLEENKPNYLKYNVESATGGPIVFSEIFYEHGWVASIDGKEANILRANYVLRALEVPAGKHTIEFRFRPAAYYTGNAITAASSWIMILMLLGAIAFEVKKRNVQ